MAAAEIQSGGNLPHIFKNDGVAEDRANRRGAFAPCARVASVPQCSA
jgi:hypothetical protein